MASRSVVDRLLQQRGFTQNPFTLREADREGRTRLDTYFFQHPMFEDFLGDVDRLESIILIAARGAGKTTFRQAIEIYCREHRARAVEGVLDVSYTEFSRPIKQAEGRIDKVNILLHVEEILRCSVLRLLEEVNEVSVERFNQLAAGELALLRAYVDEFSPIFRPDDRGRLVNDLLHKLVEGQQSPQFDASRLFEGESKAVIAALPSLAQPVAKFLERLRLSASAHLQRDSYILLIREFLSVIMRLGYKAMYVLVDRLDESSLLSRPRRSAAFVRPLLTDLELLDEPHLAFRIFLPQHLEPYIQFRRKRLAVKHIVWSEDDLLEMLALRIRSFSRSSSMQALCEQSLAARTVKNFSSQHRELRYVDLALVRASNNLPRNLILRCRRLLEIYEARNPVGLISEDDLLRAIAADLGNDEPAPPPIRRAPTPAAAPTAPATPAGKGLYIGSEGKVWRDGKPLVKELAPIEFKILQYLCEHRYQLCPSEDIFKAVWGGEYEPETLRVALKRLRSVVEYDGTKPQFIITVRGRGLRLVDGE